MVDSKQSLSDGMVKISVSARGRGGDIFASDPSTETHLTTSPMLRDPYEAKVLKGALVISKIENSRLSR